MFSGYVPRRGQAHDLGIACATVKLQYTNKESVPQNLVSVSDQRLFVLLAYVTCHKQPPSISIFHSRHTLQKPTQRHTNTHRPCICPLVPLSLLALIHSSIYILIYYHHHFPSSFFAFLMWTVDKESSKTICCIITSNSEYWTGGQIQTIFSIIVQPACGTYVLGHGSDIFIQNVFSCPYPMQLIRTKKIQILDQTYDKSQTPRPQPDYSNLSCTVF